MRILPMTRLKIILLCLILTLAASACGLKGPLYLPEASDTAAPASVEPEEETDDDESPSDETRP
ncbi:MAG TPA: lipoprotein [Xanthomonadales bacterium]|nr:lipoprotein [Xanthomonadales bacterium]